MSFVGDFLGDTLGGITGAKQQGKAAERAAGIQAGASEAGIAENRRQFDELVRLMSPFVTQGTQAFGAQGALVGLGGSVAQQDAIRALEGSPQFTSLIQQGENALLQNAAATGGLRGGNTQNALATLRPQMLSALIESQYSKLGGLSQLGQASAAGQASAGMQSAGAISDLLAQQGAARAGGMLAQGSVVRQTFQDMLDIAATATGGKKAGLF